MMLDTRIPESLIPRQLAAVPWDKEPVTDSECTHPHIFCWQDDPAALGRGHGHAWGGCFRHFKAALCCNLRAQGLGNTVASVF